MKRSRTALMCCLITSLWMTNALANITSYSGDVMMGTVSTNLNLGYSETGETDLIQMLNEQQDVTLSSSLTLDLTASYLDSLGGPWNALTNGVSESSKGTLAAGTKVRSHLLHFDPQGDTYGDAIATITFDDNILGLMVLTNSLDNSDFLGLSSITYPSGDRKLENIDTVTYTLTSPNTLVVDILAADVGLDEVRVITIPAPAGVVLGMIGLSLVGWIRRRFVS